MNVSVIIATYGSEAWRDLAMNRAYPSALNQGAHEVIVGHDPEGTIASVRNSLAEKAGGDWLCFLDADDELAPGYLDAMTAALRTARPPVANWGAELLLTPAVSYVRFRGRREPAKIWPECPLWRANWLVIGTLVLRDFFLSVGGFEDYGWSEDWQLWAKCWKAGAVPVKVPEAVYVAHVSPHSRNRGQHRGEMVYWHQRIGHDLFPDRYESPTPEEDAQRAIWNGRRRAGSLRLLVAE